MSVWLNCALPTAIECTGNISGPIFSSNFQVPYSLQYSIGAGQSYPLSDASIETDYYRAVTFDANTPGDHVQVLGKDRYYQIWFGHRMFYVRAADVDIKPAV